MWQIVTSWCNKNKAYLTTLFLASLAVGIATAVLCVLFPPALVSFSNITIFGAAPLAFLTAINFPLAVFTVSAMMTGISSIAISVGIMLAKQVTTIGTHIFSLVKFKEQIVLDENASAEGSYDFFKKYLQLESPEFFEDEDDEEYHELTFDNPPNEFIGINAALDSDIRANNDAEVTNTSIAFH